MKSEILAGTGWKVSKYKEEYCQIAYDLMRAGFTFERLARRLGTSRGVLNGWRKAHPDFAYACEMGRDHGLADWDDMLEDAIYMKGIINVSLFKFMFKNRFLISQQVNPNQQYKPLSLRELYADQIAAKGIKMPRKRREFRSDKPVITVDNNKVDKFVQPVSTGLQHSLQHPLQHSPQL